MKRDRSVLYLILPIILAVLILLPPEFVQAKGRSIFIGDLISVRVSSKDFTESDLRDKFKAFEIVDVTRKEDAYLITLRSFEPGEKTIRLGDKEIKISIKSTLKEIKGNGLFEGGLKPLDAGFQIAWQSVFYVLMALLAASGGLYILRFRRRKKNLALSPFQRFNRQMDMLAIDEEGFLVRLSEALKAYFEARYSCSIKGKTSAEIIGEVKNIPGLEREIHGINAWLTECDYYKFTGAVADAEKKQELRDKLMEIIIQINTAEKEA